MGIGLLIVWTLGSGTSIRFLPVVEMSSSSNELHSSSVVSSIVNERGIKVLMVLLGLLPRSILVFCDPVFKVA